MNKHLLIPVILLSAMLTLSCSLVTRAFSQPLPILNTGAPAGLIAYSGIDGNIYTIDKDGKQKTAITHDAIVPPSGGVSERLYQFPTWSPDARSLAFVGYAGSAQAETEASLYIAQAGGKKLAKSFSSPNEIPFYLFWSPNSQRVSFLTNNPQGDGLVLRLTNAAGANDQVVGSGQPFYWDWSPDSQTIFGHTGGAYVDNPDARMAFYQLGSSVQKKDLNLKPGSFQAPAWSPDGKQLLIVKENDSGQGELVLVGQDGTNQRTLYQAQGQMAFAWSPDGSRIASSTSAVGAPASLFTLLILLDPAHPQDGKEIANGAIVAFFWSPNGRKIAYLVPTLQPSVEATPNDSQGTPKIYLKLQVYDLAAGKAKQAAVFQPTRTFFQTIPFFDQYQRSGTLWSPDSNNLVLSAIDSNGDSRIIVVGADGGQFRPIADGDLAFWSWK